MSSKNIPSPARSQGATTKATSPTLRKSRRTRSVSSVTSNTSLRLTAVIRDSFPTSPITDRLSVLNDDTDIEIPGGQNWWRRLGDNSKRVSQLMDKNENESGSKVINFAEEIDIEILSQEKENMSVHMPESSDGESIQSIVIPQRKLFNHPEKKIKKTIYRKEILGKTQKSYFDHTEIDKDINVMPKKLFNQGRNPKTKSVFTASLLGESSNKTSIEKPEQEVQGPVHNLFGNRANTKRKNIYAEFLLSDSEEEISEIQPKVFQFQRTDHEPMTKQKRRSASQSSVHSSASNLTDVSEWQHLPSSTMVEHQFEEATPSKWLSRLSRSRKSEIALNKNNSLNQSKRSNRSDSKIAQLEAEKVNIINTRSQTLEKSKNTSNVITNKNESARETPRKNSSKIMHNISIDKTLTKVNMQVDLVNEGHEKTLTEENQHNDEEIFDVNATMVEHQFEEDGEVISSNRFSRLSRSRQSEFALSKNNSLNQSKRSNRSNSKIVPQEAEKIDIINTRSQTLDKSKNTSNVVTNKNKSLHENSSKIMHDKTLTEQIDLVNERREKTLTEENQHNDEENFALFDVNAKNYEANQDISENIEKQRANIEIDSNEIVSNLNKTNEISKDKNLSKSPEAVLHDKTNRGESFTPHDGHTSMSKSKTSKTMIKELNIRPSLAPARESSGFTDGTIDSSAQNSGWDSHRTTRKTLRLTYGKDFTPSKSLRTLVMEKSAKRQTNFNQNDQASGLVDKSKHQESFHKVANQSKDKSIHQASSNEDPNQSKQQNYFDANAIPSEQEIEQNEEVESDGTLEQNEESGSEQNEEVLPDETLKQNEESGSEQNEEVLPDETLKQNEESGSEQNEEVLPDETLKQNEESGSEQKEVVEPDEPLKQNGESVLEQNEESGSEQNGEVAPDETLKQNEESELEQNEEVEPDETLEKNEDSGSEQNEEVEPDGTLEHNEEPESDHNETLEHTEEVEPDGTLKQNEEPESEQNEESGLNLNDEIEPDGTLEQNEESGLDQNEEIELDRTLEQNEESGLDLNEEIEPDERVEQYEESGSEQNEESESEKELEQNEEFESHREPESMEVEEAVEESDNEASKRNFKNYLEKLKQDNAEIRRRVHEKVLNSLKRPQPSFSAFKMPEVPKQRRSTKTIRKPAKPKLKSTMFTNLDHMPPQFFEDLKYKPPKRFTGRNAPWITKRLYKYLEDKLQLKYGCHARVRAEKLVEKLYVFAKEARKCERAAPPHRVQELKLEMARLAVVTTHHEFYRFFHEFMPREIRIRVNPDIMNKIPLPRNVFGNIIEEEED